MGDVMVGTAGWSLPTLVRDRFGQAASQLERYATGLQCVEINSSFYRPHRPTTYQRWAASVPDGFRFAVKVPKAMTHDHRLRDCDGLIAGFAEQVAGLGHKRGPLLVQLPPSLSCHLDQAGRFFAQLTQALPGQIVLEPRHGSWFTPAIDEWLADRQIARVAADPAPVEGAGEAGGWPGFRYLRLHGSPKIYYSDYGPDMLNTIAATLHEWRQAGIPAWCIFDNTALGHATVNALAVSEKLRA